jgi:hypothetical protein
MIVVVSTAAVLLNLAAIGWYYKNIAAVMQHIREASSGPLAELYGQKDSFINSMGFWLGAVQNAFFLPVVLLMNGVMFLFAGIRYFSKPKIQSNHFTICGGITAVQILTVLATFSLNSNRDGRYLLPLLPYVALLVCWGAAHLDKQWFLNFVLVVSVFNSWLYTASSWSANAECTHFGISSNI